MNQGMKNFLAAQQQRPVKFILVPHFFYQQHPLLAHSLVLKTSVLATLCPYARFYHPSQKIDATPSKTSF